MPYDHENLFYANALEHVELMLQKRLSADVKETLRTSVVYRSQPRTATRSQDYCLVDHCFPPNY